MTGPGSVNAGTVSTAGLNSTYTRNAKVVSAEIDPDHVIPRDTNFFNNSYTTTRNAIPARKTNQYLAKLQPTRSSTRRLDRVVGPYSRSCNRTV